MRYRVLENDNIVQSFSPQYFEDGFGWKAVYTDNFKKVSYETLEDAKEACMEHAAMQPKIVWTEDL